MKDNLKLSAFYADEPKTKEERLKMKINEKLIKEYNNYIDELRKFKYLKDM